MSKQPREEPWFQEGLQFTCTQCGDCCTGAPGFVWLNDEEIFDLAELRGLSVEDFLNTCTKRVGKRISLTEFANGDCVFFKKGVGCTVYAHRPRQCRTWPFWDSNLESRESWNQTCRICPGSGQGELHTVEEIIERSKLIRI